MCVLVVSATAVLRRDKVLGQCCFLVNELHFKCLKEGGCRRVELGMGAGSGCESLGPTDTQILGARRERERLGRAGVMNAHADEARGRLEWLRWEFNSDGGYSSVIHTNVFISNTQMRTQVCRHVLHVC